MTHSSMDGIGQYDTPVSCVLWPDNKCYRQGQNHTHNRNIVGANDSVNDYVGELDCDYTEGQPESRTVIDGRLEKTLPYEWTSIPDGNVQDQARIDQAAPQGRNSVFASAVPRLSWHRQEAGR